MVHETVLMERRGDIRILTLNRPEKLNAADLSMQRSLLERVLTIESDPSVRAVVLTAVGRAFCAGGDVSLIRALAEGNQTIGQELSSINEELLRCMLELDVPVIAAVNGPAIGFGAALLALCDIVVMADGAFLSEPHVTYGLAASPACQLVWPHLTSRAIAKELLMSGRRVEAAEALRIGLVNRVTPPGEVVAEALQMAQDLACLPPQGMTSIKRAFNRPLAAQARQEAAAEAHPVTGDREAFSGHDR